VLELVPGEGAGEGGWRVGVVRWGLLGCRLRLAPGLSVPAVRGGAYVSVHGEDTHKLTRDSEGFVERIGMCTL
jgi:hypothetical protein